jgi:hypothetical protein
VDKASAANQVSAELLAVVQERYRLTPPLRTCRLSGGYANDVFRIDSAGAPVVLHVKHPPVSAGSIAWEHQMLVSLAGWLPEALPPLPAVDGSTWFLHHGRPAWLVAHAPGASAGTQDRRAVADVLGRLHAAPVQVRARPGHPRQLQLPLPELGEYPEDIAAHLPELRLARQERPAHPPRSREAAPRSASRPHRSTPALEPATGQPARPRPVQPRQDGGRLTRAGVPPAARDPLAEQELPYWPAGGFVNRRTHIAGVGAGGVRSCLRPLAREPSLAGNCSATLTWSSKATASYTSASTPVGDERPSRPTTPVDSSPTVS